MGSWISDWLVTYIGKVIFDTIGDGVVMQSFQHMKNRQMQIVKVHAYRVNYAMISKHEDYRMQL